MSKLISAAAVVASLLALSACETIQGAGRDLQSAGQALEKAVE